MKPLIASDSHVLYFSNLVEMEIALNITGRLCRYSVNLLLFTSNMLR